MAGHSKWKNIQFRKGAQDAKRGKMFTKIATEITVAAKVGGGDPDTNPRLRTALIKARGANMPKDNIERAVKKGTGGLDGVNYSEKVYEGYGPNGVAILVETLTDNINRTVSEIRYAFSKYGGNLGTDGSVAWMFKTKGLFVYEKKKVSDYDRLFEVAIDNGAEDVKEEEDSYEILSPPEDFEKLKAALDGLDFQPDAAEVSKIPDNYSKVEPEKKNSLMKLVDLLEDCDDVQNVYHNGDLDD